MNYLSLCCIARDEDLYIHEFICYYKLLGVEKFYIYDNGSKMPLQDILKKYGTLCEIIPFDGVAVQMKAYQHCLNKFGKQTKWLLVCDLDEFVFSPKKDTLPEILCEYEKPGIGGLGINWKLFGSNSYINKPNGLVIESYTKVMPNDHIENVHIKSCIMPEFAISVAGDPHSFLYKPGYNAVNENYEIVRGPFTKKHFSFSIVLHHYVLKSFEEYKINKLSRARADTTKYPGKTIEDFFRFDKDCTETNTDIFRFIPKVKEEMEKYK
jgi:hypothetical protein